MVVIGAAIEAIGVAMAIGAAIVMGAATKLPVPMPITGGAAT